MGRLNASGAPKKIIIEATVIRKNGKRQSLGAVSFWHRNPIMRLKWKLRAFFGRGWIRDA